MKLKIIYLAKTFCIASLNFLSLAIPVRANVFFEPTQASAQSDTCKKYIKDVKEIIQQTETAIASSKVQLKEAETRAIALKKLMDEGAISKRQVDMSLEHVAKIKKELETAIAQEKQAKQQLEVLKKRPDCYTSAVLGNSREDRSAMKLNLPVLTAYFLNILS